MGSEMSLAQIAMLLLAGAVLFFISLMVRVKTGGKYEIKPIDLAMVLVPLVFWLVGTNKLEGLSVGGLEIKMAQAFVGASKKPIELQIEAARTMPVNEVTDTLERAHKAGVERIPSLIEKETEAIEFRLGHGGYFGPAIRTYFDSLAAYAYLKYAIVYEREGGLFCVYSTKELLQYFRGKGDAAYQAFATSLNRADEQARADLARLPGFIPGEYAVRGNTNKRSVLKDMEKWKVNVMPVVDEKNRFIGMVNRDRLTASLIIEVSEKLEEVK